MFARLHKRVPTIRGLAYAAAVASVLIALLVAAGLISTSSRLESATNSMSSSAQSFALAREAQTALLMYQRISNLQILTGDPDLERVRLEILDELRDVLASAEGYVASETEQALLNETSALLELYLQQRAALENREAELEEFLQQTQSSVDGIVQALEAVHDLNQTQLIRAQSDAMRWNRRVSAWSGAAALVLVCGLLAMAWGINRTVLKPILALHRTIGAFRAGETDRRTRPSGLREVRELAQGFNAMADALARQRESQLAFLAGVAHDLRNPLHALRLGMQALAEERSQVERSRTHDALDRQLDRLERMVDDLLDATRIEAGQLEMRFEECDLRVAVDDMIRLYAPTSPEHRISAKLPDQPVIVEADPLRLEQVVSNLLSNAIKYSPRGGAVRVEVETQGDEAVLSVADEGIGINPDERSDIFLPFRPRKAEAPAGAGVGLSVVRRIVEAHGGRIDVESDPGQGTVFRVVLKPRVARDGPDPLDGAHVSAS
ncbi:MAG TPA: ATP-binding protein [Gammaproteobacteria bacterium]